MNFTKLLGEVQLHGAKRLIGEKHRSKWSVVFLSMTAACLYIMIKLNENQSGSFTQLLKRKPLLTRYEHPAVRICPHIMMSEQKIDAFLEKMNIPDYFDKIKLRPLLQHLSAHFYDIYDGYSIEDLEIVEALLHHNGITVRHAIMELMPSCEEILLRCRWHKKNVNCSELFRLEITAMGLCCVFNAKALWRNNVQTKPKIDTPKVYIPGVGLINGLLVAVDQSHINGPLRYTAKKFIIQSGGTFVDTELSNGTYMDTGVEYFYEFVLEKDILGDTPLESISHGKKMCRMSTTPLNMFPVYSYWYCLKECLVKTMLETCGCIRASDYNPPGVELCRANQLSCIKQVRGKFSVNKTNCNCPRTCDEVRGTFNYKSRTILLMEGANPFDLFYEGLNLSNITVMRIAVSDYVINTFERRPYFNGFDLFSQAGGLFNIFFGCSILTILEIFMLIKYYIADKWKTFRHTNSKLKKRQRRFKKKNHTFVF